MKMDKLIVHGTEINMRCALYFCGLNFRIFQRHWAEISAALAQLRFWQVLLVLAVGLTSPGRGSLSW